VFITTCFGLCSTVISIILHVELAVTAVWYYWRQQYGILQILAICNHHCFSTRNTWTWIQHKCKASGNSQCRTWIISLKMAEHRQKCCGSNSGNKLGNVHCNPLLYRSGALLFISLLTNFLTHKGKRTRWRLAAKRLWKCDCDHMPMVECWWYNSRR